MKKELQNFNTLQSLTQKCETIILCLTGTPQVKEVLTCQNGLLSTLQPGTTIIDCSTSIPNETVKLAKLVIEKGGSFLDAPMTRTPKEALEGRLNLIVGGNQNLFQEKLPLLETFAENITYAGAVGSGHSLKLLHNFISLGFSAVLTEAIATAKKSGVKNSVFHEIIENGGGKGVILDRLTPYILKNDTSGFQFSLANGNKDLSYYLQMIQDLEAPSTVAKSIASIFAKMVQNGHEECFIPEIAKLLLENENVDE